MADTGAASSDDGLDGPPSRLVPLVRTWHRVLSHGQPLEASVWERGAWDEHVRVLRRDLGRRRAVWEIARSSVGHMRHRMSHGVPTAIPAGVLMLIAFVLTVTNPDGLPTLAHLSVTAAMAWTAALFLGCPQQLPRPGVLVHGLLWAVAMGLRWHRLFEIDEVGDVVLQAGHVALFLSGIAFAVQAIRGGSAGPAPFVVPFVTAALGSMLVALANVGWSQSATRLTNILGMLGFGAVAALAGSSQYRIRRLPMSRTA